MSEKRKPKINVHCHLFNYRFIPDDISKLLTSFPEKLTRLWIIKNGLSALVKVWPGKSKSRLKLFFDTYSKPIEKVSSDYAAELENTGIDIYTPSMMNLEEASKKPGDTQLPYKKQIDQISAEIKKYPWRIFPFVMFDPRSRDALELTINAIEEKGFIGVKMYPAIGYHPDPNIVETVGICGFEDNEYGPNIDAAKQLQSLYEYCAPYKIPITTHVTPGGSYSTEMQKDREKYAWPLTEVSNWNGVLSKYDIKINFAHFGGNFMEFNKGKRVLSKVWQRQILNLMIMYNKPGAGRIFTDLSYHDMALNRHQEKYFRFLNPLLAHEKYKYYLMYGTDASVISHSYSEKDYFQGFLDNLTAADEQLLLSDNPSRFLFDDQKIPDTYINFLRKHSPEAFNSIPDYIIQTDDGYEVV